MLKTDRKLLETTKNELFFIFDQKYYKQCDSVAMGSPLDPHWPMSLCIILTKSS